MTIEKAATQDSDDLTEITKTSKAYWGYSAAQINLWADALTVTTAYIETNLVYKLVIDDTTIGYYSFFNEDEDTIRLDNLFVLPQYIGKGLGRLLMDDFLLRVAGTGTKKVMLESEPNAEMFYAKCGFVKTGQIETGITGRYLPVMELQIDIK